MQYPKLVMSKTSSNEVTTIEWNPGMDLLATVFDNGALTCSRLLSLQKVWHKQSVGKKVSIAWRPDGKVLVIGAYNEKTKEHVCTLHDVENGKKINTIVKDRAITSVAWFQYSPIEEDNDTHNIDLYKKSLAESHAKIENFSHILAHEQTHLNILMISTDDGLISFYALGLFYLGNLQIHNQTGSSISKTHMSSCLRYITTIIEGEKSGDSTCTMKISRLETFQKRSNEILKVAKMYAKITDELEYLDDTINAITTSWADVLAGLDNKLSSYCSRKNKNSDDQSGYTLLSADELLQLLVIGFPSDNLEKFLSDMSDKGLGKLNQAIEQTCLRVQNLIVKNAQKCCYHLHSDLNLLRGMSLWRERFEEVGLDDKFIVEAMRSVGSFMLKLTELQQVIDHSLKSTKSFFRWLISIAYRSSGEHTNSVVPNNINKTTQQDIQLITDFILENFDYNSDELDSINPFGSSQSSKYANSLENSGILSNRPTCSNFTLEQVGQYLKNESLSRLKYSFTKPDSNFWIEFFKQCPEAAEPKILDEDNSSVLLFYPHNPETSLIQEHKRTRRSIESAFDSVAANIKLTLSHSDSIVDFKNFISGAPINRVRVETNMKQMKHYTLFQTQPSPVDRQHLISYSLSDKTFTLISIGFIASSRTLKISDSNFYENKSSKELLLTFLLLDTQMKDTIIVQVDLNKLIDASGGPSNKNKRDLVKILADEASIIQHSQHLALKVDLITEPAVSRSQDLDMMVKRIKSTTGIDMYSSSGRRVIAFTSCANKRLHLYELFDSCSAGVDVMDDEVETDDRVDESLIDTELNT